LEKDKLKILILGSTGMAGHMIHDYLGKYYSSFYEIIGISRVKIPEYTNFELDVCNIDLLEKLICELNPQVIINCIGSLISQTKDKPSRAVFLNSYLPLKLSEFGKEYNFKLIHLSTDCVFSGKRGDYNENDFHDATDLYGKSKSLGEFIDLRKNCVLRTSIIGPEIRLNNEGLFDWFFKQKGQVKGFNKAFWSGITTLELARTIAEVIEKDLIGLYHVTNGVKISKFNLLSLIKEQFFLEHIHLFSDEIYLTDKSIIISEKFNFNVNSYLDQIKHLYNYMKNDVTKKYDRYF
jgi:dTDP-4-dehydrorhamnose reductase